MAAPQREPPVRGACVAWLDARWPTGARSALPPRPHVACFDSPRSRAAQRACGWTRRCESGRARSSWRLPRLSCASRLAPAPGRTRAHWRGCEPRRGSRSRCALWSSCRRDAACAANARVSPLTARAPDQRAPAGARRGDGGAVSAARPRGAAVRRGRAGGTARRVRAAAALRRLRSRVPSRPAAQRCSTTSTSCRASTRWWSQRARWAKRCSTQSSTSLPPTSWRCFTCASLPPQPRAACRLVRVLTRARARSNR